MLTSPVAASWNMSKNVLHKYAANTLWYTAFLVAGVQLVNREMFWVVTEVCAEQNQMKRMKIIKHFIKIASESCIFIFIVSFFSLHQVEHLS